MITPTAYDTSVRNRLDFQIDQPVADHPIAALNAGWSSVAPAEKPCITRGP
jgi:hypothetical protein